MTILLQDIYQVKGRSELPFEEALRERLQTADAPGTLVLAAWLPHGGGEGYEFCALTELADGAELDAYHRWGTAPDGTEWTARLQDMCYTQSSSLHELRYGTLGTVRAESEALGLSDIGRPPLYRLDRLTTPSPAEALAIVGSQFAVSPPATAEPILVPVACWSPLLSVLDTPEISVFYRFGEGGFRRASEQDIAARLWDGEIDLDKVAAARDPRILRSARAVFAPAAP